MAAESNASAVSGLRQINKSEITVTHFWVILFFLRVQINSCCLNVLEALFCCILRKAAQQAHEARRMLGFPSIV